MDKLQDAVLKFYAHNLVEIQEMNQIKEYFVEIDKNGDGILTLEEVEEVMKGNGHKKTAQKIFKLMDYEKNNMISYEEFIKAVIDRKRMKSEENIKRCFDAIDTKKDGKLSYQEVKTVILSAENKDCLLYTSPSPRDLSTSRMPSSA